jgi:hypothetical protein
MALHNGDFIDMDGVLMLLRNQLIKNVLEFKKKEMMLKNGGPRAVGKHFLHNIWKAGKCSSGGQWRDFGGYAEFDYCSVGFRERQGKVRRKESGTKDVAVSREAELMNLERKSGQDSRSKTDPNAPK